MFNDNPTPTVLSVESTYVRDNDPDDTPASVTMSLVQGRQGKDISPRSLRSPDDPEAKYRKKGHRAYEGYFTSITETCDLDNTFQPIVKVQN
jgi:hypothetical protein